MEVTYEAIGRCPECGNVVVLFDIDEPMPAHSALAKVACTYRGLAVAVRRVPLVGRPKPTPGKSGKAGKAAASAKTPAQAEPKKKLSKKQVKRTRAAQVARVVREGNRRLYGETREPRSTSVKTVSGGLPSLGRG